MHAIFHTLLFCTLLTSCQVHEKLEIMPPAILVPDHFSEEGQAVEQDRWWEAFSFNELNGLVGSTLENNFDLQASFFQVAEACAFVRIEQAKLYPHLDFISTLQRSKPYALGLESVPFSLYRLGSTLSYEVDLWQKNASKVRAARLTLCRDKGNFFNDHRDTRGFSRRQLSL